MNNIKPSLELDNEFPEQYNHVAPWNRKAVLIFFALTIVFDISIQVLYLFIPLMPLQILSTWTPNISAVLVLLFVIREDSGVRNLLKGWTKWRVSPKYYIAAITPFFVAYIATVVFLALGGVSPGPELTYSLPLLVIVAIMALFTGATGEELGWRGFALPRLQSRFNALTAGVLVGVWWGIWHIPGWFLLGQVITPTYIFGFFLGCITESVFMTWLVNSTKGSLVMASIFHYSVNMSVGLFANVLGLITYDALGFIKGSVYVLIIAALVVRYGYQFLSSADISSRSSSSAL